MQSILDQVKEKHKASTSNNDYKLINVNYYYHAQNPNNTRILFLFVGKSQFTLCDQAVNSCGWRRFIEHTIRSQGMCV